MQLIVVFLVAFLLSLLLTAGVRKFARARGIVALPRKDRWHQKPTALLGGMAIYATVMVTWLIFARDQRQALPVMLASTVLFVIGLIDDLRPLKPLSNRAKVMPSF